MEQKWRRQSGGTKSQRRKGKEEKDGRKRVTEKSDE